MRTAAPRMAAVLAAAALLACAAAAGPHAAAQPVQAAQPAQPRPPGVPQPLDLSFLPSPQQAAAQIPFNHGVPEVREQLGRPELRSGRGCVADGDLANLTVEASPWGQQRLRFDELHKFATGRDQLVAVIDTGVNGHPRLAGRLVDGGDFVRGETALDDCDGHGTLVAGIIAASRDAATGFDGIAPDARILAIRQSSLVLQVRYRCLAAPDPARQACQPVGGEFDEAAGDTRSLALAVVHAVAQGATVVNISEAACFAAAADQVNGRDLQAAVRYAVDNDVVVVAAAGNADGRSPCNPGNVPGHRVTTVASPAWFDEDVLTVAAVGEDGDPAAFTLAGPWVDVAAPGTGIVSLDPASDGLTNFTIAGQGQGPIQGTSFAAPYVAGLAALVKQRYPHLTARQVMRRIELTATHAPGHDRHQDTLGNGMVDPVAALTAVLPEEHGEAPPPARSAPLEGLVPQPVKDPLPTRVALAGAGAGLVALAVTGFVVFTVHRARRRRTDAT